MENKGFVPPRPPKELQSKSDGQKEEKKISQTEIQQQKNAAVFSEQQKSEGSDVKKETQNQEENSQKNVEKTQKNDEKIEKPTKPTPKIPIPPKNFKAPPSVKNEKVQNEQEKISSNSNNGTKETLASGANEKKENVASVEAGEASIVATEKGVKLPKRPNFVKPKQPSVAVETVAVASAAQSSIEENLPEEASEKEPEKKKKANPILWNWMLCGVSFVLFVVFLALIFV